MKRENILGFGQSSDAKFARQGPDHRHHRRLGTAAVDQVKQVLAGTWKSTDTWDGGQGRWSSCAPIVNVPDDVRRWPKKTMAGIQG